MLEEFAWRVYNAMLGRAVRGMRGVKPMDKRWIQCAEESRRALLKRYPAAGEAELREFCAAAGRFGQTPAWGDVSAGLYAGSYSTGTAAGADGGAQCVSMRRCPFTALW